MNHRPRKQFGQNFLQDQQIIMAILEAIHPQPTDTLIEIGPGLGALTKPLLTIMPHLIAIEIDRDLQAHLEQLPESAGKLELVKADALTIPYNRFGEKLRIIGNLPYNISTPLLLHLLQYHTYIEDMHFMLQKEVVNRLAAQTHTKDWGRLSIMVQYFCEVDYLFDVPPAAFYPAPKVDSAIVRLRPWQQSPYEPVDVTNLSKLVAQAFGMRRKTLANNLKTIISADMLKKLEIDPGKRPEEISIAEYIRITNQLQG